MQQVQKYFVKGNSLTNRFYSCRKETIENDVKELLILIRCDYRSAKDTTSLPLSDNEFPTVKKRMSNTRKYITESNIKI